MRRALPKAPAPHPIANPAPKVKRLDAGTTSSGSVVRNPNGSVKTSFSSLNFSPIVHSFNHIFNP